MNQKIAIFAFTGEAMCFAHALLNALDLQEKGYDVMLIIEGSATGLVADFEMEGLPFYTEYRSCIKHGIIAGVCHACASKMGTLDSVKRQHLTLLGDMHGHPSMEEYIRAGYDIITF